MGSEPGALKEILQYSARRALQLATPPQPASTLNDEQAACLADPNGPVDLPGAYKVVQDLFEVRARAIENFRTGNGMEWGDHDPCLFEGTERFFRAGYRANLVSSWLPALGS